MDKQEMAKEIGTLEGQISDGEGQIRKTEEKLSNAKRNRTYGLVAIVIGVLGIVFLSNYWWLWGFIGIVGLLTLLTARSNVQSIGKEREGQQAWMTKTRARLAELRALMTVG